MSDEASADPANDSLSVTFRDADGKTILKERMSYSTAVLDSDVRGGVTTYILKCESSMGVSPSFVYVDADRGTYGFDISMPGLQMTPYAQYGIRVVLDDDYSVDLTLANSFSGTLVDDAGKTGIIPDHTYSISLYSIETGMPISPASISGVKVSYYWYASESTHIIMFVNGNTDYGMLIVNDGDVVTLLSPSGGKDFNTWMDQNDNVYEPGSEITVHSDYVMYGAWGEVNIIPISLFASIYIIILIVFFSLCGSMYISKKS